MASIEIKSIVPRAFNAKIIDKIIPAAMRLTTGRSIKRSFEKTVKTWEHKPRFDIETKVTGDEYILSVFPAGEHADLYALVSEGSPRHPIPLGAPAKMSFQTGYKPKTTPGQIGSFAGGSFGPWATVKGFIDHPGFEGRAFGEAIAKKHKAEFVTDMQKAMNEAAPRM